MKNIIFVGLGCVVLFVLLCGTLVATLLQDNINGIAAVAVLMYGGSAIAGWGITILLGLVGWDLYKGLSPSRRADFRSSWEKAPVSGNFDSLVRDLRELKQDLEEAKVDAHQEFALLCDRVTELEEGPDIENESEKELLDKIERSQGAAPPRDFLRPRVDDITQDDNKRTT